MSPEFGGRAQAQHLVEGVAGHGVAEPGRDVPDGRAFLLRLLDLGIHEDGTARAEIDGVAGEKGGVHEIVHTEAEAGGEGFQKGPAAC